IMTGISMADSTGIWFAVSMGLCLVPAIVLGIEGLKKQKAYKKALENSRNIDYLTDCVIFGEWEMN
ncbi:MAG: hypothetical protein II630_05795, partial [Bacteroidales bacterium]|nr:hypothetical protein [Bacteroidales bacterium]